MSATTSRVAVALGSNLGDRAGNLRLGFEGLRRFLDDLSTSGVYETDPLHEDDQPRFLNACVVGMTHLSARQLLSQLQDLERLAGRVAGGRRYGPRTLDLDILLYGCEVVEQPHLSIPHPRMRERAFVLVPLAELVPDWEVPDSGGAPAATVAELAGQVDVTGVERINFEWEPAV